MLRVTLDLHKDELRSCFVVASLRSVVGGREWSRLALSSEETRLPLCKKWDNWWTQTCKQAFRVEASLTQIASLYGGWCTASRYDHQNNRLTGWMGGWYCFILSGKNVFDSFHCETELWCFEPRSGNLRLWLWLISVRHTARPFSLTKSSNFGRQTWRILGKRRLRCSSLLPVCLLSASSLPVLIRDPWLTRKCRRTHWPSGFFSVKLQPWRSVGSHYGCDVIKCCFTSTRSQWSDKK